MSDTDRLWTNQAILHHLLWTLLHRIHSGSDDRLATLREAALDPNPQRLKDRLIDIQLGVLLDLCHLIDGTTGPSDWPGVQLVNAETKETLSDNLVWAVSEIEGAVIAAMEPPVSSDEPIDVPI